MSTFEDRRPFSLLHVGRSPVCPPEAVATAARFRKTQRDSACPSSYRLCPLYLTPFGVRFGSAVSCHHTLRYIADLFRHEGPRSLSAKLKRTGWVNHLTAGTSPSCADWSMFVVFATCTDKGMVSRPAMFFILSSVVVLLWHDRSGVSLLTSHITRLVPVWRDRPRWNARNLSRGSCCTRAFLRSNNRTR